MTNPTKPASGGPKKSRPGTDPKASVKPGAGKAPAGNAAASKAGGGKGPAARAQSKKIVNQRQTPWGLIITTVVIVALAVGVIGYALHQGKKSSTATNSPDKIVGIVHKSFPGGNHVNGVIKYAESPPMGGPHAPVWADCTGTVYPNQIASENVVHDLEHGAVWITYKPGLPNDQLDVLTKLVSGQQYMILTPYAGLKTNVSLQAWGYQLFVDSASDPRVTQFITDLKLSQTNTPELGASCTNAAFKTNPSTPGHPTDS
ncbi:MAG: DUF3105 domain-containing protein [Actinomycetota bacterium]|nr:DUF3105 domain-containing protein [Actinomycetota bacterium]